MNLCLCIGSLAVVLLAACANVSAPVSNVPPVTTDVSQSSLGASTQVDSAASVPPVDQSGWVSIDAYVGTYTPKGQGIVEHPSGQQENHTTTAKITITRDGDSLVLREEGWSGHYRLTRIEKGKFTFSNAGKATSSSRISGNIDFWGDNFYKNQVVASDTGSYTFVVEYEREP